MNTAGGKFLKKCPAESELIIYVWREKKFVVNGAAMHNKLRERERNVLFNDALNTFLSTVIWRQTYG